LIDNRRQPVQDHPYLHQLVMQRIFLCLLGFFSLPDSYGQQIELHGAYQAPSTAIINFYAKDSFSYMSNTIAFETYGIGRYKIEDKWLYLYFRNKEKESSKIPVITKKETSNIYSIINVSCFNYDSTDLLYGSIMIEGTRNGSSSDSSGIITLKVFNNMRSGVLIITSVGMEAQKINLDLRFDHMIRVFLSPVDYSPELDNGEIYQYEIKELSEDMIILRQEGAQIDFWEYKKYKKEKATRRNGF
jgi:hypothetical protein